MVKDKNNLEPLVKDFISLAGIPNYVDSWDFSLHRDILNRVLEPYGKKLEKGIPLISIDRKIVPIK